MLVLASDGVWDFIDDQEVIDTAKKFRPDANAACKALVEMASSRWVADDPTYRDDISCTIVRLPPFEERPSSRPRRNSRRITQF